jgi:AraC-like DNA-binding protein
VAFDQRVTGLVFHPGDLDAPITSSDPSLRPYARQFLSTLVAPPEPAATSRFAAVVETVELLLPLGRNSLDEVGRHLGLGPRALQRYLADHQETFSSVVHATRARLAERYLANGQYSLTEVSQLLGFSAPSSFTRWFRQQYGTSPTEWRRTARSASRTRAGRGRTVPGG